MKKYTLTIILSLVSILLSAQISIIRPDTIEPVNLSAVNGKMLYFHRSNPNSWQFELWSCDGTNAGTHLVKDINPNSSDDLFNWFASCGVQRYSTFVFNDELYFLADDGVHGMEIWKSDGTSAGTNMLIELESGLMGWDFTDCKTPGFAECNGTLYMSAGNSVNGYELWKSDGTTTGTVQVMDLYPGSTGSNPHFMTAFDSKIYFIARDDVHGWELFSSDGTPGGTSIVKDIVPGTNGAFSSGAGGCINPQFKVSGQYLYFQADNDGLTPVESHWWRTDGTDAGTIQLETTLTAQSTGPYDLVVTTADMNGQFVFIASSGSSTSKFWKSDGTPTGTVEVPMNNGLQMRPSILALGSYVFFNGMDNDSSGLAISDGTTAGSEIIFNYVTAGSSFNIAQQKSFNGNMFFHITKYYGIQGAHERVAQTNGTTAGTIVYAGVEPLSPFIPVGNDLIFYGHDTIEATPGYTNLYKLTPDSIPPVIGLGVSQISDEDRSISVYPNPVSSEINLQLNGYDGKSLQVQICDLTGRIIAEKNYNEQHQTKLIVDLPETLAEGIYLLNVRSESGYSKTISFIIQKQF